MKLWPQPPASAHPSQLSPTQCPNCGAFGNYVGMLWRDLRTGKTYRQMGALDAQVTGTIFVASVLVSYLGVTWLFGPDSTWLILITAGILSLTIIAAWTAHRVSRETHAVRIFTYRCTRCLHQWTQQEGKPTPRFNEAWEIQQDYKAVFGHEHEE